MAAIKYRDPVTKLFVPLVGGMSTAVADGRYEPIGSVDTHEAAPNPHAQYLLTANHGSTGDPHTQYVLESAHGNTGDVHTQYLLKAGGTMTGDIMLKGAPTASLHPATKTYADQMLPKAAGAANPITGMLYLTGTNGIYWASTDTALYQDAAQPSGPLYLANGAWSAYKNLVVGEPAAANHAATKNYVDVRPTIFSGTSGSMPGGAKVGDIYCQYS